jgi:uncharacterized protein YjeT (DUF2065 family)
MDFFLCVIGMVLVFEGLPYFVMPDKMRIMVQKLFEMPDSSLRGFGFFMMITGVLLVYLGKR